MQFDLTQAEPNSGGDFELIPAKTVAPVIMHIRETKQTRAGDAEYLSTRSQRASMSAARCSA